uniref:RH1 domain-containing protein n=1 Tax=Photinus pyralis TaxID=7054 RepID=A0A1Y1KR30_PHOPY
MPRKYRQVHRKMEETNDLIDDVTVVDVYDIASDIGKECEKIIDLYGADAVTSLMPKVISALELLENLAVNNERENSELLELKSKISQLENDKIEKAEYRQKFEKELEAIEEQWRAESKELLALVSRLQDENRKLAKVRGTSQVAERVSPTEIVNNSDMLQKLQLTLEKQRDEIRVKEKLLQEKCGDMEKVIRTLYPSIPI